MSASGSEASDSTLGRKRRTPKEWFRKYFLDGQELAESARITEEFHDLEELSSAERFVRRHRKLIAMVGPLLVGQFIYWCTSWKHGFWRLYPTHWHMPVTMILGATIAGMTSEGGGAIAFPVMTFILHMSPKNGRDFSIVIQSIAMTMSLLTITFMRLELEWHALTFSVVASIPGLIVGFHYFDPALTAPQKKMLFVSIWSSFAIALWILNRQRKRQTFLQIQRFCFWKAVVLMVTGFVGGIFTSFAGSGLDICMFAVTTLLFSVSEKTATPTTVVAMALCSMFAFFWRAVMMGDMEQIVFDYVKVTVPISITLAPFGSFLGSHFHRQVLAHLIYAFEFVAMVGFLSTRPPWSLVLASGGIVLSGFALFSFISWKGRQLLAAEADCPLMRIESAAAAPMTTGKLMPFDAETHCFRADLGDAANFPETKNNIAANFTKNNI